MKILMISPEVAPFAKVGGLGDVLGSLPKALEKLGCEIRIVMPKYSFLDEQKYHMVKTPIQFELPMGDRRYQVEVFEATMPDSHIKVFFISHPDFFHGQSAYAHDHKEYAWLFLSLGALFFLKACKWKPDVIHCHDSFSGLVPMKLHQLAGADPFFRHIATALTIHNLAHQGDTDPHVLSLADIDPRHIPSISQDMQDNDIDMLYEGVAHADVVNTVSPSYAKEIMTKEYGEGMEDLLMKRKDRLFGILNGIDDTLFDPERDEGILARYSVKNILPRAQNKLALQKKVKFAEDQRTPLLGIVTRLATQKGIDFVLEYIQRIQELHARLVVLGTGDSALEEQLTAAARNFPDHIRVFLTFDLKLASEIYAGCDLFLVPSRYEPCGLTQMIAMRYGCVPIARETGGLKDTIIDYTENPAQSTGFLFQEKTSKALYDTIERAIGVYRDSPPIWEELMMRGMKQDFSWDIRANEYVALYKKAIAAEKE